MAGLMDILLALVQALCGGRPTTPEPPPETQQQPYTKRPTYQQTSATYLKRPQEQEPKPLPSWPRPEQRSHQELESKPLPSQPRPERRSHQEPESKPLPSRPRPEQRPHQDQNQINQQDEDYVALRAKATEHGDLMARCFQESHEAYGRGDGARAKQLSEQGRQHEREMEGLNAEASAWIYKQNNLGCKPGEIDLHGLYVKEAVSYVEKGIQEARQRGDAEIRLIVGKGLHSSNRVTKIKPAIEDLMRKHNIPTEVDPQNAGVLIAQLR